MCHILEYVQFRKILKIQIEARIMEDVIQSMIVPAVVDYQNKIIQNILFSGSNISNETLQADLNNKFKFFNQNLNYRKRRRYSKTANFKNCQQLSCS